MARCTSSIVGSPPNRPRCAGWPRWWRAALNRWRYLARWPRRCADACLRTRPDCGASKQATRLPSWPPLPILRRWHDGRWAPELRWTATPSQRWCDAAAGPRRIDSYDNIAGPIAARVREVGVSAAVAVPLTVDGRVWGLAAVGSLKHGAMSADTEVHISRFAELIATALVAS